MYFSFLLIGLFCGKHGRMKCERMNDPVLIIQFPSFLAKVSSANGEAQSEIEEVSIR